MRSGYRRQEILNMAPTMVVLALAIALLCVGCQNETLLNNNINASLGLEGEAHDPLQPFLKDVDYTPLGDGHLIYQRLNLYKPDAVINPKPDNGYPVVIAFEGGGFVQTAKLESLEESSTSTLGESKFQALQQLVLNGVVVISATHRVTDATLPTCTPETYTTIDCGINGGATDATTIVQWSRFFADELELDANKIFVFGNSSGGISLYAAAFGADKASDDPAAHPQEQFSTRANGAVFIAAVPSFVVFNQLTTPAVAISAEPGECVGFSCLGQQPLAAQKQSSAIYYGFVDADAELRNLNATVPVLLIFDGTAGSMDFTPTLFDLLTNIHDSWGGYALYKQLLALDSEFDSTFHETNSVFLNVIDNIPNRVDFDATGSPNLVPQTENETELIVDWLLEQVR